MIVPILPLALGASPIMADCIEEVEDMVSIASSLVFNIGMLNTQSLECILFAGKYANQKGDPIMLDPVASTQSCGQIQIIPLRANI